MNRTSCPAHTASGRDGRLTKRSVLCRTCCGPSVFTGCLPFWGPSGMRGVLNDAVSIYFLDPTLASAFVARWCAGYKVETAEGVLRLRNDEPTPRTAAELHRTP